jgi:hypothetical protein
MAILRGAALLALVTALAVLPAQAAPRPAPPFPGIGLLDSREACLAFAQRHRLALPNGYGGEGKIAKLYAFTYQPWWAVIDKNGMLLRAGYGPGGGEELAATIRALTR